jgi:hypothetical protein
VTRQTRTVTRQDRDPARPGAAATAAAAAAGRYPGAGRRRSRYGGLGGGRRGSESVPGGDRTAARATALSLHWHLVGSVIVTVRRLPVTRTRAQQGFKLLVGPASEGHGTSTARVTVIVRVPAQHSDKSPGASAAPEAPMTLPGSISEAAGSWAASNP